MRLRFGVARFAAALVIIGGTVTGCSQTTRVGETTSAGDLSKSQKAVAVMRLGAASQTCQNVGVWLGVREGNGFRPVKPVAVINHRSLSEVPVAEVELHPGEYHIISYACGNGSNVKQIADTAPGGLTRSSYASFSLSAGEIVNVGSFEFHAARVGLNAFGRPYRTTVTVKDWPLAEIDRYKEKRPQIYAQMKTRLMTPTPRGPEEPDEEDCARLGQLKAEGKVQNVPANCPATNAQTAGAGSKAAAAKVR
jgi:hypothetical protein